MENRREPLSYASPDLAKRRDGADIAWAIVVVVGSLVVSPLVIYVAFASAALRKLLVPVLLPYATLFSSRPIELASIASMMQFFAYGLLLAAGIYLHKLWQFTCAIIALHLIGVIACFTLMR